MEGKTSLDAAYVARLVMGSGVQISELLEACQRIKTESKRTPESKDHWLIPKEVMGILRVSRSSLWRLVSRGELETVKLSPARSGRLLISSASVDALLEAKRIVKIED